MDMNSDVMTCHDSQNLELGTWKEPTIEFLEMGGGRSVEEEFWSKILGLAWYCIRVAKVGFGIGM